MKQFYEINIPIIKQQFNKFKFNLEKGKYKVNSFKLFNIPQDLKLYMFFTFNNNSNNKTNYNIINIKEKLNNCIETETYKTNYYDLSEEFELDVKTEVTLNLFFKNKVTSVYENVTIVLNIN